MPSADDPGSPPETPRRSRGLRAFFRRLRREVTEPVEELQTPAGEAAAAAATLVGQARAFQTLTVDDVMTPRADIVAVEVDTPFEDLVALFIKHEHSRLPIYRDTLDDPIGVVHVKDVFKSVAGKGRKPAATSAPLKRLKRETLYVPASKRAAELLAQMQKTRIHLALVIDEYGGTEGLVTIEDLIEAVVGEIDDEHDEASAKVVALTDGAFSADGLASVNDLADAGIVLPEDTEGDTAGGMVLALLGRLPRPGDSVIVGTWSISVDAVRRRRISRVTLRPRVKSEHPAVEADA